MQKLNSRIKLLPAQVVQHWELVKHVVVKVDEVDEKDLQPYLNELLHSLLNNKAQCFLGLDEKRNITGVWITRLMIDKITGEKYLFAQALYSFKFIDDENRKQEIDFIKEFARKEQCSYISFRSRNKRIWEIGELNNFQEKFRTFEFRF